jgi:cellulose synthase operon protein C
MKPTRALLHYLAAGLIVGCGLTVSSEERLDRAQVALSAGNLRSALLEVQRVLQAEPDNGDARLLLATALLRSGDFARATEEYRRATELGRVDMPLQYQLLLAQARYSELLALLDAASANTAEIALLRAAALTGNRDFDAALQVLAEVERVESTNTGAGVAVARIHLVRGELGPALAKLESMESYAASDLVYWQTRGTALLSGGRYDEAATALERADELASRRGTEDPLLLAALVQARLGSGDVASARSYAARLEKAAPNAPGTLMVSARVAAAEGNDTEAAALLQRLLADDPRNSQAALLLGTVQLRQGRFGQALAQFRAVLNAYPEHQGARRLAAAAQMRMNRPDEAVATLGPLLNQGSAGPELAAALLESGEPAAALRLLESVPDSLEVERLRIAAHVAAGDRVSTQTAIERLLALHPQDAQAMNIAGLSYRALGEFGRAEELLRTALQIDQNDIAVRSSLVALLLDRGDTAEARQLVDALAKRESALAADQRLRLWVLVAAAGDADLAARRLSELPADQPAVLHARIAAARALASRGFTDLSERLIDHLPNDPAPRDQAAIASIALSLGQADRALAMFTAVADALDQPEVRIGQALAQLDLGQRQYARGTLQALLAEQPNHVPALVLLARVQQLEGDSSAATATAGRVRELDPSSSIADGLRGDLLVEQGNHVAAAAAYREAFERNPSRVWAVRSFRAAVEGGVARPETVLEEWLRANHRDVPIRALLAQHYLEIGDRRGATENYERLLTLDSGNAAYANNLAWLYVDTDPSRAFQLAQEAYAAQPNSAAIADTLGWTLVKVGRQAEAVPLLRRAATIDDPEVQYHLAVALAETGAAAEARALLEQVLKSSATPDIHKDTEEGHKRL